ncbi:MAG TPA: nitrite reductase small subunit NirD [Sporichthyaceae bacterium]|nr:nitrite reductase small subunit NirD [Sporichthyaceae bacterium]
MNELAESLEVLELGTGWVDVIAEAELETEVGVPALVGAHAVAVFRTHDGELFAVSNIDPRTGSSVIARGIVGSRGEIPTVASPLYKEVYDLRTGYCLDDQSKRLEPYEVRIVGGIVQVRGIDGGR